MWCWNAPMFRNLFCALFFVLSPTLGGAASGQPAKSPVPAEKNLVGWWKLDETAGTTVADSSKHERKGTLEDGLSFDSSSAPGRIGKALKFDGKQNRIKVTGYKGVTGMTPRTAAVWIKTSKNRGDIIRWGSNDAGKIFRIGFIRGHVGLDPSGGYLYMNENIADDKWHHVVIVVTEGDPPNLHDHAKLYLDGKPAAIHDIGLLDLWPLDTGDQEEVTIGRGFSGLIDEVRLNDRALTGEEIEQLFAVR